MLPQDTDWFRNQIAAPPHEYDSPTSTKEKLERRAEFDRWLAEVKAEAWEEGYGSVTIKTLPNPYRQGETE